MLGSLPGERSLRERRYYAHPANQFWRLLGQAIDVELHAIDYDRRLALLADRRVALWDVVATATRTGSLDGALRAVEANPLFDFVRTHADLRCIGFNGKTAARIGRRELVGVDEVAMIDLPSSSPAYTIPMAEKYPSWARLGDFASRA